MSRYPYTYACDYIRSLAGHDLGGTKISRADASQIIEGIAEATNMTKDQLAKYLADAYLEKSDKAFPKEAERNNRHKYEPHLKYPWMCKHCGYAEHEKLIHY